MCSRRIFQMLAHTLSESTQATSPAQQGKLTNNLHTLYFLVQLRLIFASV